MYIMTRLIEQKPQPSCTEAMKGNVELEMHFFIRSAILEKKESLNILIFCRLISLYFSHFVSFFLL